jgi:hypothetical protein
MSVNNNNNNDGLHHQFSYTFEKQTLSAISEEEEEDPEVPRQLFDNIVPVATQVQQLQTEEIRPVSARCYAPEKDDTKISIKLTQQLSTNKK